MKTVQLSPIDHVFAGRDSYSVEFLSLYPYRIDGERLRKALEKTTRLFWPVCSELKLKNNCDYEFLASNRPLDFKVVEGGKRLPNFQNPEELADFSDVVQTLPDQPLAKFRLTHIGDHSVFVANVSHALVDGFSYFFFLSVLAANYRYSIFDRGFWRTSLIRPDLDRSKLAVLDQASNAAPDRSISHEEFYSRTGFSYGEPRTLPTLADSRWQFIRFEPSEVLRYSSQESSPSPERRSKHDIITALLWKRVAEEWHTSNDDLECSSAFDYRRIHGGLSPFYWGNAITGTATSLSRNEILSLSVVDLAARIRQATQAINREKVLDGLKYLDEVRRTFGPEVFQNASIAHRERGLLVTNLSRIDAKSLDFGSGAPTLVIPLTAAPRAAVLLSDGDSVVARLGLPS